MKKPIRLAWFMLALALAAGIGIAQRTARELPHTAREYPQHSERNTESHR